MKKVFLTCMLSACFSAYAMDSRSSTPTTPTSPSPSKCLICYALYRQATDYSPAYFKKRDGRYSLPYRRFDTEEELCKYLEEAHKSHTQPQHVRFTE